MEDLGKRTVQELLDLAQRQGLSGYSKLKKSELIQLLSGEDNPRKGVRPEKDAAKAPPSKSKSKEKSPREHREQEGKMAESNKNTKAQPIVETKKFNV